MFYKILNNFKLTEKKGGKKSGPANRWPSIYKVDKLVIGIGFL